jgi:tetratricopeptide (TPR) repeat protein
MDNRTIWVGVICAVSGIVVGFLLANSLNRSELAANRLGTDQATVSTSSSSGNTTDNTTLSPEELNATIQKADRNAGDLQIQRSHGVALYRYGAMKQDVSILQQSIRILERATSLDPKDYDVLVTLGNAYFDVAYFSKDDKTFPEARKMYGRALAVRPEDVDVQTDIGLTYYLETPPDFARASAEFKKALAANPRHEKSLVFLVETLAKQNKRDEAAGYLEKLRSVNPDNRSLDELSAMVAGASSPAQ